MPNALQTPSGAPDTKSLLAWPSLLTPPASTEERVSRNFQAPVMYRECPPVDALAHRPTVMRCSPQHVGLKGPWIKARFSPNLTRAACPTPGRRCASCCFHGRQQPVGRAGNVVGDDKQTTPQVLDKWLRILSQLQQLAAIKPLTPKPHHHAAMLHNAYLAKTKQDIRLLRMPCKHPVVHPTRSHCLPGLPC